VLSLLTPEDTFAEGVRRLAARMHDQEPAQEHP
jgi:hypothetical protein